MAEQEDIMALNALLGLTASILEHAANVKNINTSAEIARDELQFRIKKEQTNQNLEFAKMEFELNQRKIDQYDSLELQLQESMYERTGKRYKFNEKDITSSYDQLQESHSSNTVDRMQSLRAQSKAERSNAAKRVETLKNEIESLDKISRYINTNLSPALAGNVDAYDVADYKAAVTMAKEEYGIKEFDEYQMGAISVNQPSLTNLIKLNAALDSKGNEDLRMDITKGTAEARQRAEAETHLTYMGDLLSQSDKGDTSETVTALLQLAKDNKGKSLWGLNMDEDTMFGVIKDLATALSGDMYTFEQMLADHPHLREAIKSNPALAAQYQAFLNKKASFIDFSKVQPLKSSSPDSLTVDIYYKQYLDNMKGQ